jgi:ribosome-binding factor A
MLRDAIQGVVSKGLHDPRVRGLVTITRVNTSEDFSSATVYVSVLPAEHRDLTLHGLRAAAPHIRHQVADKLDMRRTPDLLFKPDVAAARTHEVLDALAKVAQERERRGENAPEADTKDQDYTPPDAARE